MEKPPKIVDAEFTVISGPTETRADPEPEPRPWPESHLSDGEVFGAWAGAAVAVLLLWLALEIWVKPLFFDHH